MISPLDFWGHLFVIFFKGLLKDELFDSHFQFCQQAECNPLERKKNGGLFGNLHSRVLKFCLEQLNIFGDNFLVVCNPLSRPYLSTPGPHEACGSFIRRSFRAPPRKYAQPPLAGTSCFFDVFHPFGQFLPQKNGGELQKERLKVTARGF
jgi:hypothetical protein